MDSSPPQKKIKLQPTSLELPAPIAVLGDEYYADVEEVEVFVGTVLNKSYIGDLIQRLKTVLPMPETLTHLKRVKGDEILLTLVQESDRQACANIVTTVHGLQPVIEVRKVPGTTPKTKQQHRRANALWPCNFHPSKEVESLLASTFFTTDQVTKHYDLMKLALHTAEGERALVGAVVVNPRNGKVVATAHDERSRNPSNHAVMMVLERVAAVQRDLGRTEHSDETKDHDDLPYLCTGYDLYVTREPCIMCAMAMIHCRVRRVFYGYESEFGALGSRCKVHTRAALNHHYLAFRNILSDECRMLEMYATVE